MNTTTRTSKYIVGDSFKVYCDIESSVEVFIYSSGQLTSVSISYSQKNNNFKMVEVSASMEGYYFVRSGKNVQSLKKGNIPYRLFMFDSKHRTDLILEPWSHDEEGSLIGKNEYEHLGFGIYSITPLVLTPSIVEVFGKIFYSFPNAENRACGDVEIAASSVSLSTQAQPTVIRIGGSSVDLFTEETSIGLSVGQTIFKV